MSQADKKFLRRREVADRYGIAVVTLDKWVQAKKFPKPIRLVEGGQAIGWPIDVLEAHDATRIAASQEQQQQQRAA